MEKGRSGAKDNQFFQVVEVYTFYTFDKVKLCSAHTAFIR
jgi:hypothetical protein